MATKKSLLIIILLQSLLSLVASSTNTNFSFQSFSFHNLTLLGDSHLRSTDGSVGLTRDTAVPVSSSGTALLNVPVQFLDRRTNRFASFSTNFTFIISNPNPGPGSSGDGLTFFVSPSNFTLGSTGAYLGLFNSSPGIHNRSIFAVEFDTKLDEGFNDSSGNHVGLDVDGPVSIQATDLDASAIDLKSGSLITAWIDYCSPNASLKVFLSRNDSKPKDPVLAAEIDLANIFNEYMYVGFSASTEGGTELHTMESWSFETFGLPAFNVSSSRVANNVSDASWTVNPETPFNSSTGPSHKNLSFGLVIVGPVVLAVASVMVLWLLIKKAMAVRVYDSLGPRKFSYTELSCATRGFHCSRIIGSGAFGTVYRAVDPRSGADYAVKRSKQARESKAEFIGELTIIAGLRHKNLVQLQGWCTDKNELLLVYEFMPNGSLDKILYPRLESGPCVVLSWDRRYNVAAGMASVLAYLHQECDQRVIHRDIKTSNIMLDSELNPRLGDFGLARLMDHNMSPVSTLTAGTMGYLAPEYLQYGKYTEKTDVFSYGVVVLEVCCGRRPIEKEGEGKESRMINLVDFVWNLYAKDRILEAVDGRLNGEFDEDGMLRLLLLGLSCVNPNSEERPSMRRVVQILNSEAEAMAIPRVKPLLLLSSSSYRVLEIAASDDDDDESGEVFNLIDE